MPARLRAYVWSVIALALALGLVSYPTYPIADWRVVGAMAALAVIVSNMSFALPYGASVSLGFTLLFAALLYGGPMASALVALAGGIPVEDIRTHKPPLLMLGNSAQLFISALVAGMVAIRFGAVPLQDGLARLGGPSTFVAPMSGTACFFILNLLLVGIGISLRTGMPLGRAVTALQPVSYAINLVVLGVLGYLMAHLIALRSWVGLVLLVMPFVLTRRVFRVYVELSEAYTSTVRSLVAAIEAKDPYLRGHSERVADYARRLALRVGLGAADVQLVERAALLHDLGKVAAPLSTLMSSNGLSDAELEEIHQHPVIGSQLLSGVEFLGEAVPIVLHHHERIDGRGYPDRQDGEAIPLLSRILAVADAYDAMTSDRPYRVAMSSSEAIKELRNAAGTQLEERLVEEFVAMQTAEGDTGT